MTTGNRIQATDYPSFTKAMSSYIYKQLNVAPYLGGVHSTSLGYYYGKRPCQLYTALVNPQFYMCTSLTLRTMTMVFGFGTRLGVRMKWHEILKMTSY